MAPTVFREGVLRFFFFSREESRMHIHVSSGAGEAKFWITPAVELAMNQGLTKKELSTAKALIEQRQKEIIHAWLQHFGS